MHERHARSLSLPLEKIVSAKRGLSKTGLSKTGLDYLRPTCPIYGCQSQKQLPSKKTKLWQSSFSVASQLARQLRKALLMRISYSYFMERLSRSSVTCPMKWIVEPELEAPPRGDKHGLEPVLIENIIEDFITDKEFTLSYLNSCWCKRSLFFNASSSFALRSLLSSLILRLTEKQD